MENDDKYELTKESKIAKDGVTKLFRLKAKVEFKNKFRIIKKGEVGGWIESLKLKSGDARLSDNAWVSGNAEVYGDARVYGDAEVYGDAWVYGDARVYGDAWVYGDARVYGDAEVYGDARVYGNAWVSGRFDLSVNIDFELKRITIDTKEKLTKLKDFLEKF